MSDQILLDDKHWHCQERALDGIVVDVAPVVAALRERGYVVLAPGVETERARDDAKIGRALVDRVRIGRMRADLATDDERRRFDEVCGRAVDHLVVRRIAADEAERSAAANRDLDVAARERREREVDPDRAPSTVERILTSEEGR